MTLGPRDSLPSLPPMTPVETWSTGKVETEWTRRGRSLKTLVTFHSRLLSDNHQVQTLPSRVFLPSKISSSEVSVFKPVPNLNNL